MYHREKRWTCKISYTLNVSSDEIERCIKKNFFWGKFSQMWEPIHPRVFVGFGKTKGEIRVKKRDFRGNLGGWLRGLDLVWESATQPTHIWERSPKKIRFFWTSSLGWKYFRAGWAIKSSKLPRISMTSMSWCINIKSRIEASEPNIIFCPENYLSYSSQCRQLLLCSVTSWRSGWGLKKTGTPIASP